MGFFRVKGTHYMFYLTNGNSYCEMFFQKNTFLKTMQSNFFKHVVQINFQDKYRIIESIGKGSFAKVGFVDNGGLSGRGDKK